MKECKLIQKLEAAQKKGDLPIFRVGDTICVHTRIIEGDKERIQLFTGTVIARKGGGLSETVSLYRHSYGAGMERVFAIHSPKVAKVELVKSGKVRRSKLYHIRGKSGRASKVQEQIGTGKEGVAAKVEVQAEPAT